MSPLAIVLIVVLVVVAALAIGGAIATARRARADEARLRRDLAEADEALAAARAEDRGWDRDVLRDAAREAAGTEVAELHLVQVVDRLGTEDDQARFRAVSSDGTTREIVLGRHGDGWVPITR